MFSQWWHCQLRTAWHLENACQTHARSSSTELATFMIPFFAKAVAQGRRKIDIAQHTANDIERKVSFKLLRHCRVNKRKLKKPHVRNCVAMTEEAKPNSSRPLHSFVQQHFTSRATRGKYARFCTGWARKLETCFRCGMLELGERRAWVHQEHGSNTFCSSGKWYLWDLAVPSKDR